MNNALSVWSFEEWALLDARIRQQVLRAKNGEAVQNILTKNARQVLRQYSTSFFIVTRFLPPKKRAQVEAIYAAVRYPDEIVDSFKIADAHKQDLLSQWETQYEIALPVQSTRAQIALGVPCFLANFAQVVQATHIPPEHYRAFLTAMKIDLHPRKFASLEDLIETYIYGSAIVVGYFLAYVYGSASGSLAGTDFKNALASSKDLGIALQLTNFLRDVAEDQQRGRMYLPQNMLSAQGLRAPDANDPLQHQSFNEVLKQLTAIAENYYASAQAGIAAFAPDCRTAIQACIKVYRELNQQIAASPRGILHRASVPMRRKFEVLPMSKYWRLPLAYLSN